VGRFFVFFIGFLILFFLSFFCWRYDVQCYSLAERVSFFSGFRNVTVEKQSEHDLEWWVSEQMWEKFFSIR
jgi:hypothetical protein